MRVEVFTRHYEFAHGKLPRGRGYWAFDIGGHSGQPWFAPGEQTYSEAKKAAIAEAQRRGVFVVWVAS